MDPLTFTDVRIRWTAFLRRVDQATGPVTVHRLRRGRPTTQLATPVLAAFNPDLYERQVRGRWPDAPPVVDLYAPTAASINVTWPTPDNGQRVQVDARRARSGLTEITRRVTQDGLHVLVRHRNTNNPKLVLVFTPLDFAAQQPDVDHPDQRSPQPASRG